MSEVTVIWVTTTFEGFHQYPGATDDVGFLRSRHRHVFHVKVEIQVYHDDREIEFIGFKRFIDQAIDKHILQIDTGSCETIARILSGVIQHTYPNRSVVVDVSEDGENGAVYCYFPTS